MRKCVDKEEVKRLYLAGYSYEEIAKEVHSSKGNISRMIYEMKRREIIPGMPPIDKGRCGHCITPDGILRTLPTM